MQFTGPRLSHGTLNSLLWKKISQRHLCQCSSAGKQQAHAERPQSSVLGSSLTCSPPVSHPRHCHYLIKANAKKTIFNVSISRWLKPNFKQFWKLGHRKWTSSSNSGLKTCISLSVFRWIFWVTFTNTEPMERFYKQILKLSYTSKVMLGPFLWITLESQT